MSPAKTTSFASINVLGANWTVTSTFSGGQPVTQAKEPAMLGSRTREARRGLNAFGRSQIILDGADNAYVVLPYGRIVTASKASGWTDWTLRFDGSGLNAFGEVVVDRSRMTVDGILSILYQRRSSSTTPSPIRVIDFRLN